MNELYKYRNLIYELVVRDIKKKYRRSILGVLWSMLNPLFMMLITAMVFSNLFRFDIQNFAVYLLTGQIIFTFYAEATNFAMGSILDNSSLLKKIYVPKYLFPLSRVLSSLVNLIFTIPAMLIVMLYTGEKISLQMLWICVPLILLFLFCLGIGLLLATCAVFFRDIFHLYGVLLTVVNYATPIFYPIKIIPQEYINIILLNPLYYYLEAFREIVYNNQIPNEQILFICLIMSIISLFLGTVIFYKKQNKFILYI